MLVHALGHRPATQAVTDGWVTDCAATGIEVVEESRSTWRVWHVRAVAERQARTAGVGLADLDVGVDRVVGYALDRLSVRLGSADPIGEPAVLCRADGGSVYDVHGATSYTSARVPDAERRLFDVARATSGRRICEVRVGIVIAEDAANGVNRNDAQAAMVRDLATSGRRLQLALAPAGTGKTTAMRVLGRAWSDTGGQVIGLAPSAQAAHEFGPAIPSDADGGHTDTLPS